MMCHQKSPNLNIFLLTGSGKSHLIISVSGMHIHSYSYSYTLQSKRIDGSFSSLCGGGGFHCRGGGVLVEKVLLEGGGMSK